MVKKSFGRFARREKAIVGSDCQSYFQLVGQIAERVDTATVESMVDALAELRQRGGRLFLLGVGGSAANCAHAVNDFRKLCGIEAYAPTDNVSELTARINDDGWDSALAEWLKVSRLDGKDALMIFSVGGGNVEKQVSVNLVCAIDLAKERGATVMGIVGRDGGYTKKAGDVVVVVPTVDDGLVTPLVEAFQAVIWHHLVSNPKLQVQATKW